MLFCSFIARMDLVKGPHEKQLMRNMRKYLDKLVEDEPLWVAGKWTKTNYSEQMSCLVNTTCSLYMFPRTHVYKLKLTLERSACHNHHKMMKAMHAWKQEPDQVSFITNLTREYNARKTSRRRGLLLYLRTGACGDGHGHATFLFFDFKRNLQIFFDPQMGLDWSASFVRGFAELQMIPGCVPIPLDKTIPLLFENSLQEQFQQNLDVDDKGVCGVLVLVVTMLCIRFQYYNPLHISQLMIQAYPRPSQRTELTRKLISWYFSFQHGVTIEAIADHVHKPSTIGCSTFSGYSGRLCSRPSCNGEGIFPVYCWQHRHIVKNTRSKSKKCSADQRSCA